MLLRIELNIINPMNGKSKSLVRQFDPATMDQAKWSGAFPAVAPLIQQLVTDAGTDPNEPAIW